MGGMWEPLLSPKIDSTMVIFFFFFWMGFFIPFYLGFFQDCKIGLGFLVVLLFLFLNFPVVIIFFSNVLIVLFLFSLVYLYKSIFIYFFSLFLVFVSCYACLSVVEFASLYTDNDKLRVNRSCA